jgi:hypothetical protein
MRRQDNDHDQAEEVTYMQKLVGKEPADISIPLLLDHHGA